MSVCTDVFNSLVFKSRVFAQSGAMSSHWVSLKYAISVNQETVHTKVNILASFIHPHVFSFFRRAHERCGCRMFTQL